MQFEVTLDGEKATLTYRFYNHALVLMFTTVPKTMAGRGIAGMLARSAFAFAEKQQQKVIVYCHYVTAFVHRHPELQALVITGGSRESS